MDTATISDVKEQIRVLRKRLYELQVSGAHQLLVDKIYGVLYSMEHKLRFVDCSASKPDGDEADGDDWDEADGDEADELSGSENSSGEYQDLDIDEQKRPQPVDSKLISLMVGNRGLNEGESKDVAMEEIESHEIVSESDTYVMNELAISAAAKGVEEIVTHCTGTVVSAEMIDRDAIAEYLKKGRADFNVYIHSGTDFPSAATLSVCGTSFRMVTEEKIVFDERYFTEVMITACGTNEFVLTRSLDSSFTCSPKDSTRETVMATLRAFQEKAFMLCPVSLPAWEKPDEGILSLSTSCYRRRKTKLLGMGGVIRDHTGKWIHGFWGPVDEADKNERTLAALRQGLLCVIKYRENGDERPVGVETTCEYRSDELLRRGPYLEGDELEGIVKECQTLIGETGNIMIKFRNSSSNRTAYELARLGAHETSLKESPTPPDDKELEEAMLMDTTGITSLVAIQIRLFKKVEGEKMKAKEIIS